jgi:hypothetical protein
MVNCGYYDSIEYNYFFNTPHTQLNVVNECFIRRKWCHHEAVGC